MFCAVNVPEKYATGLISWSLSSSWQKMPKYTLLEASIYSMYGLLGSGIVTMVYCRKFLLNILMLVDIYLTKQMVYFSKNFF